MSKGTGTSTPNTRSIDRFVNALKRDPAAMVDYDTGIVSTVLSAQLKPEKN
jgi:hypothetical protein